MGFMRLVACALLLIILPARADVVDAGSDPPALLGDLAESFDAADLDVLFSHDSEAGRDGPSYGDRARVAPLLGFQGWPSTTGRIDLDQHRGWLEAFESGAKGAVAAAPAPEGADSRPKLAEFQKIWKDADAGTRVFMTFDDDDREDAERAANVLEQAGYAVYLAVADPERETIDPDTLGKMFVEADHVLLLDTASARRNSLIQFEADLLADLRRQHAWVANGAEGLPPVKRGSMDVIEALGVLPMEVLPGGIVLGMPPQLDESLTGATPLIDEEHFGVALGDQQLMLTDVSNETRRAVQTFVTLEDSHSVIDIAGGQATLVAPFEDTRIGARMYRADNMPFDHLSINGAQKSLIVDDGITFRAHEGRLAADVSLEVRFYRQADGGRADRIVTLRFTVEDVTRQARLLDLRWAREPDKRAGFDGDGVDDLVNKLEECAIDAALIALARLVTEAEDA